MSTVCVRNTSRPVELAVDPCASPRRRVPSSRKVILAALFPDVFYARHVETTGHEFRARRARGALDARHGARRPPPRVHSGQCQSLSGTRVNGGLRQHRCHPLRHVSHSSMGLSASGASPHTMHGTSSSSSKSTVFSLTAYALSPTRKISPSRLIIFQYFRFGGRSCAAADFFFPLLAFDVVVFSLAFSLAFPRRRRALGAGGARDSSSSSPSFPFPFPFPSPRPPHSHPCSVFS